MLFPEPPARCNYNLGEEQGCRGERPASPAPAGEWAGGGGSSCPPLWDAAEPCLQPAQRCWGFQEVMGHQGSGDAPQVQYWEQWVWQCLPEAGGKTQS